jgi:polyhydroxybutyrate depolymerase
LRPFKKEGLSLFFGRAQEMLSSGGGPALGWFAMSGNDPLRRLALIRETPSKVTDWRRMASVRCVRISPRLPVEWRRIAAGAAHRRFAPLLAFFVAALAACGPLRAQPPAWQAHSLVHDGATRTWHEIVPAACAARDARCPLLVALHGGGGMMDGARFADGTGLSAEGARRGYVVLAPDALGANWNDGRPEIAAGIDDVGFIRAMLAEVGGRVAIDPASTFAAGASNGGLMSYRLACEAAGSFRAVAPVIANLGSALSERCRPAGPVSLFMIPGTADPLMPYAGGGVAARFGDRGTTISSDATLDFWRRAIACRGAPHRERFDPVRGETAVAATRYEGCRGGAIVQRWTVEGGGHIWPGRAGPRARFRARLSGPTATEFSATQAILDFFDALGRMR